MVFLDQAEHFLQFPGTIEVRRHYFGCDEATINVRHLAARCYEFHEKLAKAIQEPLAIWIAPKAESELGPSRRMNTGGKLPSA